MNSKELENRLIDFSVDIIKITDKLPNSKAGSTLGNQLVRSGTSPALNYGEAQSAESKKRLYSQNSDCSQRVKGNFSCFKNHKKG